VKSKTSISWGKTAFMWGVGDLGWWLELLAYAELPSSMKYSNKHQKKPIASSSLAAPLRPTGAVCS